MSPHATVFYGALINSKTLTELSVHPRALLAVNKHGVIDWIIEDIEFAKVKRVLEEKDLHHVKLNVTRKGEWLMPGFIDTHTVRSLLKHAIRV
jgi:guanine deaminase